MILFISIDVFCKYFKNVNKLRRFVLNHRDREILTGDVRGELAVERRWGRSWWRSWMAVPRMHVLYETEASCHRPEDVFSSLRGLPTLKELSATLRPGLHTPSTRTEGPLSFEMMMLKLLPFFISLSLPRFLALSLSLVLSAFAFLFLSLYSPVPLLLFSPRCL